MNTIVTIYKNFLSKLDVFCNKHYITKLMVLRYALSIILALPIAFTDIPPVDKAFIPAMLMRIILLPALFNLLFFTVITPYEFYKAKKIGMFVAIVLSILCPYGLINLFTPVGMAMHKLFPNVHTLIIALIIFIAFSLIPLIVDVARVKRIKLLNILVGSDW